MTASEGPGILVVYRDLVGDHGIDFLLVPEGGGPARLIACWEEEVTGTAGLTWPDLLGIADSAAPAPEGVQDPAARLLPILPLLSDPDLPETSSARVGAALTAVGAPDDRRRHGPASAGSPDERTAARSRVALTAERRLSRATPERPPAHGSFAARLGALRPSASERPPCGRFVRGAPGALRPSSARTAAGRPAGAGRVGEARALTCRRRRGALLRPDHRSRPCLANPACPAVCGTHARRVVGRRRSPLRSLPLGLADREVPPPSALRSGGTAHAEGIGGAPHTAGPALRADAAMCQARPRSGDLAVDVPACRAAGPPPAEATLPTHLPSPGVGNTTGALRGASETPAGRRHVPGAAPGGHQGRAVSAHVRPGASRRVSEVKPPVGPREGPHNTASLTPRQDPIP